LFTNKKGVREIKIIEIPKKEYRKRVCAYVRTSTNKDEQEYSFLNQSNYWNKELGNNEKVEYIGLFTDDGISGKSMSNRKGLKEMLEKAKSGEIDEIYTKSISRFARNKTELLETVRELRDRNIPVIFEKENINTLDPKCGLILTVMSSLAEEELISMSKNQKWAVRQRFARGIPNLSRTYGYNLKDKKLVINEEEAKGVRRMFELYLQGNGFTKIAKIMDKEGYKTVYGGLWSYSSVRDIITNETYIGDNLLQKSIYNLNSKKKNKGELPQYYVENTHEGIIDKETFMKAQELQKRKAKEFYHLGENRTPYVGRIRCAVCGNSFRKMLCAKGKSYECIKWICRTKNGKGKETCSNHEIKDEVFKNLLVQAFNESIDKNNLPDYQEINGELQSLLSKERELRKLHLQGYIPEKIYGEKFNKLLNEIKEKEEKLKELNLRNELKALMKVDSYTDEIVKFLRTATVNDNYTITFRFSNGYITTKEYTNGRAGNVNGKLTKRKAEDKSNTGNK